MSVGGLPFRVLKKYLERGASLYAELEDRRRKRALEGGAAPPTRAAKRRARRAGLKETAPW